GRPRPRLQRLRGSPRPRPRRPGRYARGGGGDLPHPPRGGAAGSPPFLLDQGQRGARAGRQGARRALPPARARGRLRGRRRAPGRRRPGAGGGAAQGAGEPGGGERQRPRLPRPRRRQHRQQTDRAPGRRAGGGSHPPGARPAGQRPLPRLFGRRRSGRHGGDRARGGRAEAAVKVLVVGGGGREHALCWKLRQSPLLSDLYCAPGNPGIDRLAAAVPIAPEEIHRLADFAADMKMDLTVVGPELPLALGLVDELEARGLAVFGPSKRAAELEGSKVFAKQFMERHAIPTAPFALAHDAAEALAAARRFGPPVVLKADGLAAGKGVFVAADEAELAAAVAALFEERRFGASADRVVV